MAEAYKCDSCGALYEEHNSFDVGGDVRSLQNSDFQVYWKLVVSTALEPDIEPECCADCRQDLLMQIIDEIKTVPSRL